MSQSTQNPPLTSIPSLFDLLETYQLEFHTLRQQAHTITNALNALIQNSTTQDPNQTEQALSTIGLSREAITRLPDIDAKFQRINDMIQEITHAHSQEQTALTTKYENEISLYQKEISCLKEEGFNFRSQYEQERTHWQLEKQNLEERVQSLAKDLEESKAALVENITVQLDEERVNKKKMEMWFKRRLDAIEHHITDLKDSPHDDKKYEQLLNKIRRLKHKQPWNGAKKKPNLMLDEAAFNQRSEVYSNGTSTPFSHYVCVLSSAATENNLLDKGFLHSVNESFPETRKSQNSFLSGPLSSSMRNPNKELVESVVRKLHDSKVSFSEKEKLFCEIFKKSPCSNDLVHVKLEDILNAANVSKSLDSISLDLKSNGKSKYSFLFNQKLRLQELKDTKLEKAISTIQSQGSQKSSDMFGTFKRSRSLDECMLGSIGANLEQMIDMDMSSRPKDAPSALDQGIIQDASILQGNFSEKETDKSLRSLKNILSLRNLGLDENENIVNKLERVSDKQVEPFELSMIDKKEKVPVYKLDERIISDSLMDDDFRHFLGKGSEEVKAPQRNKEEKKMSRQSENVKDTAIIKLKKEQETEKIVDSKKLIPQKVIRASNGNLAIDENVEVITASKEESLNGSMKGRKASASSFDVKKLKEKVQKGNLGLASVDGSTNQNTPLENKRDPCLEEDDTESKKTVRLSPKQYPTAGHSDEKPPLQPVSINRTPVKLHTRSIEEGHFINPAYKVPHQNPVGLDSHLIMQPRRPVDNRRSIHPRPNISLGNVQPAVQKVIERGSHKPRRSHHSPSVSNRRGNDISLDKEYQLHYQEQEGDHGHFQGAQLERTLDFNSHKPDFKGGRNSWSFTIEQEQKFLQPPQVQFHPKMLGRNNHKRQNTTDACPPQKSQSPSHFIRFSFAQNRSQFSHHTNAQINCSLLNSSNSQFNVSCPSSHESTQEAKFAQVIGASGLNILKRVLPMEKSKRYPTPTKLGQKDLLRRALNENLDPINLSKEALPGYRTNSGKEEKFIKPTSPIKKSQDAELKLANIIQKPKKGEEKIVQISASNAGMVNGANQFRSKMFAPKKV